MFRALGKLCFILHSLALLDSADGFVPFSGLRTFPDSQILYAIKERQETKLKHTGSEKRPRYRRRNEGPPKIERKLTSSHSVSKPAVAVDGRTVNATHRDVESLAAMAVADLSDLIEEINSRVSNGTAMFLKNLTEGFDDKMVRLPETSANELSKFLGDLANEIQKAQQMELERQLAEIDKRFVRPLEDLAFSDVPLLDTKRVISDEKVKKLAEEYEKELADARKLVLIGENSTLAETGRMRTKDILKNFNVAPFYYSIALFMRWLRKASYPSVYLLALYKNIGMVMKSNTKPSKKDRETTRTEAGESMQAGWKRTGEIASKGALARKWAILRRSAEIWTYFSSFYLKDRRLTAKYTSGQWSEEKFKAERSKLGKEITQNLLKLGPVGTQCRLNPLDALAI